MRDNCRGFFFTILLSSFLITFLCLIIFLFIKTLAYIWNGYEPDKMLDGDIVTFFHSIDETVADEWIQIDMLEEIAVKKILVLRKYPPNSWIRKMRKYSFLIGGVCISAWSRAGGKFNFRQTS